MLQRTIPLIRSLVAPMGLLLFAMTTVEAQIVFPNNGHAYEYISDSVDWNTARSMAQSLEFLGVEGELVTILSPAEQEFVYNVIIPPGASSWLGATDASSEGQWYWVEGPQFWSGDATGSTQNNLFAAWASGQPDDSGASEDVALLSPTGEWSDVPLATTRSGFVVEYALQPELDIWVTDAVLGGVVRVSSLTGNRTLISSPMIGSGPLFGTPRGIGELPSGEVIVCDADVNTLFGVDPNTGDRVIIASDSVGSGPALGSLGDLTIGPRGEIYVVDSDDNTLLLIDRATGDRTLVTSPTVGSGPVLLGGTDVILDGITYAYLSDNISDAVFRVELSSGDRTVISSATVGGGVPMPPVMSSIALEADGSIQVGDASGTLSVLRIDPVTGNRTEASGLATGSGTPWATPFCIVVQPSGSALVVDNGTAAVVSVEPATGNRLDLTGPTAGSGPLLSAPRDCSITLRSKLILEPVIGVVDAFPSEPGTQIAVELWMRDLDARPIGFESTITFDTATLGYRGDLASYAVTPFGTHVLPIASSEIAMGQLHLDGSGSMSDWADGRLATLVFDLLSDCAQTTVEFTPDVVSSLQFYPLVAFTETSGTGTFSVGPSPDCNANGVSDLCEIESGSADDCNDNGVPDECDIENRWSQDTDDDGTPDECQSADFIRGDCNGNGTVNIADVVGFLVFTFESGLSPTCYDACDANDDAMLDLADATDSLAYIFSSSGAPLGGPCGDDATVDLLGCVFSDACP